MSLSQGFIVLKYPVLYTKTCCHFGQKSSMLVTQAFILFYDEVSIAVIIVIRITVSTIVILANLRKTKPCKSNTVSEILCSTTF